MAVDMFIKIGALTGESKDHKHKESIDVLAWTWGASNTGSGHHGGGLGTSKANVQDLSFTKHIDKASPDLMLACLNGKHFDTALLTVRKAGENPLEYLKIEMTEVIITSVSTGGHGGDDRLTENVSLNFAKVKVAYEEQTATGGGGAKPKIGWDIAANKKL